MTQKRSRAEFEGDRLLEHGLPTRMKTEFNTRSVNCSICNELYFVSEAEYSRLRLAYSLNRESGFICPACDDELLESDR
jgi:transposase-like protein